MTNLPKWNADEFRYYFKSPYYQKLIEVFQHTCEALNVGQYISGAGKHVILDLNERALEDNDFCDQRFCLTNQERLDKTIIDVVPKDCLMCARQMQREDPTDDLCLLNMASHRRPGGDVIWGARAQEEYLFRCTDYYRFLFQYASERDYDSFGINEKYGITKNQEHSYPFKNDNTGIFSHGVTVFRGPEKQGYPLVNDPWRVNMIAVAAYYLDKRLPSIPEEFVEPTKERIRTILRLAYRNGQRRLVLGAFGCGAFHNPPAHMARLFKEVFNEEEFSCIFRQIRFAIIDDNNTEGKFSLFSNVFNV